MPETVLERLRRKLSDPTNLRRLFDRIDHDFAFLPYYPEMLDFELPENEAAETREIVDYRRAFGFQQDL